MRTTIDKAGRIVIPRELREQAGLIAGPVDVYLVGNAIQIEVPESDVELVERDGMLLIKGGGPGMTVEELRAFRLADQR